MYCPSESVPNTPAEFEFGSLSESNRWVVMEKLIPWEEFEQEYAEKFSLITGAPAKAFRVALGALIIKEILGVSDREVVEQIKENPYLQYFLGFSSYSNEAPFEASLLVHFRKRISQETISKINKRICTEGVVETENATVKNLKKKKKKTK
jgi:hypothetical protein